jgi:hypothetical protein
VKRVGYILTFGNGEYVEFYRLDTKEVITTSVKEEATSFLSKNNADFVAKELGCGVLKK